MAGSSGEQGKPSLSGGNGNEQSSDVKLSPTELQGQGESTMPGGIHAASTQVRLVVDPNLVVGIKKMLSERGGKNNSSEQSLLTIEDQRKKVQESEKQAFEKNKKCIELFEEDAEKVGRYFLRIGHAHAIDPSIDTRVIILPSKVNGKFTILSSQYGRLQISEEGIGKVINNRLNETEQEKQSRHTIMLQKNTNIPADQQKKEGITKDAKDNYSLTLFDKEKQDFFSCAIDAEIPAIDAIKLAKDQSRKQFVEIVQLNTKLQNAEKKSREADEVINLFEQPKGNNAPPAMPINP
jgi:hypothetical protein